MGHMIERAAQNAMHSCSIRRHSINLWIRNAYFCGRGLFSTEKVDNFTVSHQIDDSRSSDSRPRREKNKNRAGLASRPAFRSANRLRSESRDARGPVAKAAACTSALPEGSRLVLRERARLRDVLGGEPDRVAIRHRGAVIAPSRARAERR